MPIPSDIIEMLIGLSTIQIKNSSISGAVFYATPNIWKKKYITGVITEVNKGVRNNI
jgi:hypothetical protein